MRRTLICCLGSVTGIAVDAQNHVWVVHRGVESLQNNETPTRRC